MALKVAKKPSAAPVVATGKSKPGKASAPAAGKTAGAKSAGPGFKEGQTVEFVGYSNAEQENPVFQPGDVLYLLKKDKDEDNKTLFEAVKFEDKEAYEADNDSVNGDQVMPSELKKIDKPPVDPYAMDVKHVGRMDEVLEANGGDPLAAAQALQEDAAENLFLFGGLCAQLYAGQKFREYGDYADDMDGDKVKSGSGWEKFCQDQLNMGGRDCQRHITIYQKFSGIDVDWGSISRNKRIGYVKLERMAKVVTNDNVQELLGKAEDLNVADFKSEITENYVSAGEGGGARTAGPKIKKIFIKAAFFEDQAAGVQYVLDAAGKQLGMEGEEKLNQLLETIIMQWAAQNLTEAQVGKATAAKRKILKRYKADGIDAKTIQERNADSAALEQAISTEEGDESAEAAADSTEEAAAA